MKLKNIDYIENLYEKAYLCKASLDKGYKYRDGVHFNSEQKYYKNFLQEKKRNFLGATLAMKQVLEEHPIRQAENYEYNKAFFERNPEIDSLIKECEEQENTSYRHTKLLRKKLIDKNRINLNSVTPKMSTWEKVCFRFDNCFK